MNLTAGGVVYEIHPAAELLPLLGREELAALALDIAKRGQLDPVRRYKGKVIDGRNRLLACAEAEVEPWITEVEHLESPTGYVLSLNLRRRHLTPSQLALVAAEALTLFAAEARERQRAAAEETNRKKQQAQREIALSARGRRASEAAAESVGVGARTVERAKAVCERAPTELVEQIRAGKVTLRQAEKQLRRSAQLDKIRTYNPPTGRYPVIVVDPPWQYEDALDGSDAVRGGLTYPPMALPEICALRIPADEDCILWLWCTNTHLINGSAARVLEAWRFTPKTLYTWDKVNWITGHWGRGVTEHVILATRGKPAGVFESEGTLFRERRVREHSVKPEAFYRLVERSCPARPLLEMFARMHREGWVTTGAEQDLFERKVHNVGSAGGDHPHGPERAPVPAAGHAGTERV
jgi:N6-adenosine-specific RNA methylase IME4